MLPWIATTIILAVAARLAPGGLSDTLGLFVIGYGALTVFVVVPVWAAKQVLGLAAWRAASPVTVVEVRRPAAYA